MTKPEPPAHPSVMQGPAARLQRERSGGGLQNPADAPPARHAPAHAFQETIQLCAASPSAKRREQPSPSAPPEPATKMRQSLTEIAERLRLPGLRRIIPLPKMGAALVAPLSARAADLSELDAARSRLLGLVTARKAQLSTLDTARSRLLGLVTARKAQLSTLDAARSRLLGLVTARKAQLSTPPAARRQAVCAVRPRPPTKPGERFQTLEALYEEIRDKGPHKPEAEAILGFRDWHSRRARFDPRSGAAMTRPLREILEAEEALPLDAPQDSLSRIVAHAEEAVRRICVEMRSSVRREHVVTPVHAAREFDAASLRWLSRKSGRSIREKLGAERKILAVRRRMSVDTSENRLFKACLRRLEELLLLRTAAFPANSTQAQDLRNTIDLWRSGEAAEEIGVWRNPPPNNALLQDRRYRRIWDAWVLMQGLDESLLQDQRLRLRRWMTITHWRIVAGLAGIPEFRLLEQPCLFDADLLSIHPALGEIVGVFAPSAERPGEADGLPFRMSFDATEPALDLMLGGRRWRIAAAWADLEAGRLRLISSLWTGEFACVPETAEAVATRLLAFLRPHASAPPARPPARVELRPRRAVLDFSTIRPAYATEAEADLLPFDLLAEFWPLRDDPRFPVDLSGPRAIGLAKDRTIVSLLNLTRGGDRTDPVLRGDAARLFAAKIRGFLSCEQIAYIVPDTTDDFSLSDLRKGVNLRFRRAAPLPRSVARLFLHLLHEEAQPARAGDSILVLDMAGETVALTHLKACAETSGALLARAPQSGGLFWEKHPTIPLRIPAASDDQALAALREAGCPEPETSAALLGLEGVRRLGPHLSWRRADGAWVHGSEALAAASPQFDEERMRQAVRIALQELRRRGGLSDGIRLLLAGEACDPRGSRFAAAVGEIRKALPVADVLSGADLARGGLALLDLQEQAGDLPLWKEHLPELSMRITQDGAFRRLHLVDQRTTITPQRDRRTSIPVSGSFTLPAGQKELGFPLRKGGGGGRDYQAVLKSPAFPLKEALAVELRLTFAYGADDPYELVFHPAPGETPPPNFTSVRAEWLPPKERVLSCSAPSYPERRSWESMQNFPNKENTGFNDLPTWLRAELDMSPEWFENLSDHDLRKETGRLRKAMRFPAIMIWGEGRSLRDPDCPNEFRLFVHRTLPKILRIYGSLRVRGQKSAAALEASGELFFFLCVIHADAPPDAFQLICERFEREARHPPTDWKSFIIFAYAVGEGRMAWQQAMVRTAVRTAIEHPEAGNRVFCLRLLAVILWRTEAVVRLLSAEEVSGLLTSLTQEVEGLAFQKPDRIWGETLAHFAELTLALLRTRDSPDPRTAALLAPESGHAQTVATLMEALSEQAVAAQMNLKTRLDLRMDKPDELYRTPDILYALHASLSGAVKADQLIIANVRDTP